MPKEKFSISWTLEQVANINGQCQNFLPGFDEFMEFTKSVGI